MLVHNKGGDPDVAQPEWKFDNYKALSATTGRSRIYLVAAPPTATPTPAQSGAGPATPSDPRAQGAVSEHLRGDEAAQEQAIEAAIVQAANEVAQQIKGGTPVPQMTRFIVRANGSVDVLPANTDRDTLTALVAGGAKLYAEAPGEPGQYVPITIDEFYNGTDEEILLAVMGRAKQILYDKKSAREKAGEAVDAIQGVLDALALLPVVGDVATGVSGLIDAGNGNVAGAGLSLAAMVPIIGEEAAVLKLTRKAAKALEAAAKAAKIDRVGAAAKGIVKAIRANEKIDAAALAVYRAIDKAGRVVYVGITNNFARRAAEHLRQSGLKIVPLLERLSKADARAVEQVLIEIHDLGKNGGTLLNKINSIAKTNPKSAAALKRGLELLELIGYKPGI